MKISCPHCSQHLELTPDVLASLQGQPHFACPMCQGLMAVPDAAPPPSRPSSRRPQGAGSPNVAAKQAHRGLNRNLLVLGTFALLTLGGLAFLLTSRNGGNLFNIFNNITNQIVHNSYFTQLIANGVTTEKDLQAIAEIRPYGDGFIGISKEALDWLQAQELAKRTGASVLAVEASADGSQPKLLDWLAETFRPRLSSSVWVRELGSARILDGSEVLAVTAVDRQRKVMLHWQPSKSAGAAPAVATKAESVFDYSDCLFGKAKTLQFHIVRSNPQTRTVEVNGVDSSQPAQPFSWDWGDGLQTSGFFPQMHVYAGSASSFVVRVTAHYPGGNTDTAEALVDFGSASAPVVRGSLPDDISVRIPKEKPILRPVRAPYQFNPNLGTFDDSFFRIHSREIVEHVLTAAAVIQMDLANNDVCRKDGRFDQVLLRDASYKGMYSIWYTDPVGFGVGDHGIDGGIEWSSFFHEMGHNVTLNSPARYHWGLKQDGPANTIYSEAIAQIFQHATAYELLNNLTKHGIGPELGWKIAQSARASMKLVRLSHEKYVADGCQFRSWQEGGQGNDPTFGTFMTIAFKFFEHAEKEQRGYGQPVKRLMTFLQRFNPEWERSFSARKNTPDAEQFRATLWAAALSYAFSTDLRDELRQLKFPVQDDIFRRLAP